MEVKKNGFGKTDKKKFQRNISLMNELVSYKKKKISKKESKKENR